MEHRGIEGTGQARSTVRPGTVLALIVLALALAYLYGVAQTTPLSG